MRSDSANAGAGSPEDSDMESDNEERQHLFRTCQCLSSIFPRPGPESPCGFVRLLLRFLETQAFLDHELELSRHLQFPHLLARPRLVHLEWGRHSRHCRRLGFPQLLERCQHMHAKEAMHARTARSESGVAPRDSSLVLDLTRNKLALYRRHLRIENANLFTSVWRVADVLVKFYLIILYMYNECIILYG